MTKNSIAALGIRAHSGWAAVVVLSGAHKLPQVADRRRIIIADPKISGSKQPYHAAESWPLQKAQAFIERCARSTNQLALEAIREIVEAAREKNFSLRGCCLLTASGRPVPSLEAALSSHAMLHTAEGEFFRNALAEAAAACRLRVARIREKEILALAAERLHLPVASLQSRLAEMGRSLGPPWTQDEKLAALAAWLELVPAAPPSRPAR